MAGISTDEVSKAVENTLYTAVGLGVLGYQHIRVQRQQLERTLRAALEVTRNALDEQLKLVEERVTDLVDRARSSR
jgi:predicted urease superfamily metal-dependent hydrolase